MEKLNEETPKVIYIIITSKDKNEMLGNGIEVDIEGNTILIGE